MKEGKRMKDSVRRKSWDLRDNCFADVDMVGGLTGGRKLGYL